MIRDARADDLPALTSIYNHYVEHSPSTFDTEPFGDRAEWFGHYQQAPYALLVVELGGRVVGYASAGPFRAKPGYRSTVETSVYLAPIAVGQGLGRRLYDALLTRVDAAGVHRSVAGIAVPNDSSVALHEAVGFTRVGVFTEVGRKHDQWVDVAWYERSAP